MELLPFLVVSFLLSLVSTVLFPRTGDVLSNLISLTNRLPRFSLRSLFPIVMIVFVLTRLRYKGQSVLLILSLFKVLLVEARTPISLNVNYEFTKFQKVNKFPLNVLHTSACFSSLVSTTSTSKTANVIPVPELPKQYFLAYAQVCD